MFAWKIDEHIELRLPEESFADEYFALIERNRARLRRFLAWTDRTRTVEDMLEFFHFAQREFTEGGGLHLTIWVDGKASGGIGHRAVDARTCSTNIGYWLDAPLEGQGIVTRAVRAMLDRIFGETPANRVEIRCATDNTRSCAIPARLGFTREGIAREAEWCDEKYQDLVVWSLLRREWTIPPASTARDSGASDPPSNRVASP